MILIPVTEPESLACFSGEIPDQVRDEGIKSAMRGIGAAKTILPPRWGSLFYRIQRGFTPPPLFCRPYRANHKSTFYITGVHTPAYVLSPLQGYIIFHFSLPSAIIVTTDFVFFLLARQSSYKYAPHSLVRQFGID